MGYYNLNYFDMYIIPEAITLIARELRSNMTKSEKTIWNELKERKLNYKFLRQRPVYIGTDYNGFNRFIIPDFYCAELKLCLEIDGNIHDKEEVYILDREKEKILLNNGYKIIRFTNEEILMDLEKSIEVLRSFL